ncbi:hypothetical protein TNCV_1078041, partial [Trichonephila clavipes]
KANGATTTSSVEFIARSPTPSPMRSRKLIDVVCVAPKDLPAPGSGNEGGKRKRF